MDKQITWTMEEKRLLIELWESGRYGVSELADRFERSRTSVYRWLNRYQAAGPAGLEERSRAPKRRPRDTPQQAQIQVLTLRSQYPRWGPKKLVELHQQSYPGTPTPKRSTLAAILKRHGLTAQPKRKRHAAPRTEPFANADGPNRIWAIDFKGHFYAANGARCDPLTLEDAHSRYLLRCQLLRRTGHDWVRPVLEATFREYGLPDRIRSDNGPPFASVAVGGLSRLSIWWIKLGIIPERIDPGEPQQNGRLERLHKTLKLEAANPPAPSWNRQQSELDEFRRRYNELRPHEALGMKTPTQCYQPSPREYPRRLPELEYPEGMKLARVQAHGDLHLRNKRFFLTETLKGETVGCEQLEESIWRLWFGPLQLGRVDLGGKGRPRVLGPDSGRPTGSRRRAPKPKSVQNSTA